MHRLASFLRVDIAMRRFLPRTYLEAFSDVDACGAGSPVVWVHRPVIGVFQAVPLEPDGVHRHFNEVDDPALLANEDLETPLAAVAPDAARLVANKLAERVALEPSEREVLASFFALLGIRLSSRFGDLDRTEAWRGYEELLGAMREMGWVFWEADLPDYFVSSSAPFHVAFPKEDGLVQGMLLHAPGIEITLPSRRGSPFTRPGSGGARSGGARRRMSCSSSTSARSSARRGLSSRRSRRSQVDGSPAVLRARSRNPGWVGEPADVHLGSRPSASPSPCLWNAC